MNYCSPCSCSSYSHTHFIRVCFHIWHRYGGEPLIKRSIVPEVLFRTAYTTVSSLYWIGQPVIPPYVSARVIGGRAPTAYLVKTPPLLCPFIVKSFYELSCVEEGPSVITSAMGGHPGTFMIGLFFITLSIETAVVGFGFAACTHPQLAQEPQVITNLLIEYSFTTL